jgi:hypothetical protein
VRVPPEQNQGLQSHASSPSAPTLFFAGRGYRPRLPRENEVLGKLGRGLGSTWEAGRRWETSSGPEGVGRLTHVGGDEEGGVESPL